MSSIDIRTSAPTSQADPAHVQETEIIRHITSATTAGVSLKVKGTRSVPVRIITLADSFDAMTSDRPYRKGMSVQEAIEEIRNCKGTQFDPALADVFISCIAGT
jgi:hypothetical protein